MRGAPATFILGAVAGAVLGLGVGAMVRDSSPPAVGTVAGDPRREAMPPSAPAATSPVRSAAEAPAEAKLERAAVSATDPDGVVSAALLAFAAEEARAGWHEKRQDEMPDGVLQGVLAEFARSVVALPAQLGRNAAEERSQREAAATALAGADGVALLQKIKGDEPEVGELVRSKERFAELFRPRAAASLADGPTLSPSAGLADGTTIVFPAGAFQVADLARGREQTMPSDLTVRGAGMDSTLLVLDAQRPRQALRRFTVADCTVFAEQGLTDIRSAPAVLKLHRVRLIGFDCGAGGSGAIYVDRTALHADDCRFETGYGRAPGYATLVRGSGPLLARFDACRFERIGLTLNDSQSVVFASCTMIDLLANPPQGPVYENCRITVLSPQQRNEVMQPRDLNILFPQWRERIQRR